MDWAHTFKPFSLAEGVLRLAQYGFFLRAFIGKTAALKYISAFELVALLRKVMRLKLSLALLLKVRRGLRGETIGQKLAFLLKTLASLVFYATDHAELLSRLNAQELCRVRLVRNSAWVGCCLLTIIVAELKLQRVGRQLSGVVRNRHAHNAREHELLERKERSYLSDMIKATLEVPVPLYFIDYTKFHPVIVGALGILAPVVPYAIELFTSNNI